MLNAMALLAKETAKKMKKKNLMERLVFCPG